MRNVRVVRVANPPGESPRESSYSAASREGAHSSRTTRGRALGGLPDSAFSASGEGRTSSSAGDDLATSGARGVEMKPARGDRSTTQRAASAALQEARRELTYHALAGASGGGRPAKRAADHSSETRQVHCRSSRDTLCGLLGCPSEASSVRSSELSTLRSNGRPLEDLEA